MRQAHPSEFHAKAVPALIAEIPEATIRRRFPVQLREMDPWSEPEPSEGATVRLESGLLAVVVYGKATRRLTLFLPETADSGDGVAAFLAEFPLERAEIVWRRAPAAADRPVSR